MRAIPLTPARKLPPDGRIIIPTRADITDYGPPGVHLHGPLAIKGRPRAAALEIAGAGNGDGADGGTANCIPPGAFWTDFANVGPATTTVAASSRIDRPYIITAVEVFIASTAGTSVGVILLVADDNDLTGGQQTSGEQISNPFTPGIQFNAIGDTIRAYPNYRVTRAPTYLKAVYANTSAAGSNFHVSFSLVWL